MCQALLSCIVSNIWSKEKMPNQGEEEGPLKQDILLVERLKHCPECKEKGITSQVERLQNEEDIYWVCCTNREACSFIDEYRGKAVVNQDDLTIRGLPGQLIQHMDIYGYEDIDKILRLCMSEYIKLRYLVNPLTDANIWEVQDAIKQLAIESHGLSQPTEPIATNESQHSQPIEPVVKNESQQYSVGDAPPSVNELSKCDFTTEEDFDSFLKDFCHSTEFPQPVHPTIPNNSQATSSEDLFDWFNDVELFLPSNEESMPLESSKRKKRKGKKPSEKGYAPKCNNPWEAMRYLAENLVSDLPLSYQEEIKIAFSKIDGYNFPMDFANNASDKLLLFKILEEREKSERIKAETDEVLKNFNFSLDGVSELFL